MTALPRLFASSTPRTRRIKLVWYAALTAAIVAGAWAFADRLTEGLRVTNLTSGSPWGAWVALYIYFVGLSAGAFLLSSVVYVFGMRRFEQVGRAALLTAIVCMWAALGFIGLDLGRLDRALYPMLFFNWVSPLAWEVRFYVAYIALLSAELWLAVALHRGKVADRVRTERWLRILGTVGIPLAIFGVHGGTGTIFAVVKARGMWFGGLFPVIFVMSALVSGTALLALVQYLRARAAGERPDAGLLQGLGTMLLAFLFIEAGLQFYEYLVPLLAFHAHDREIMELMAFGPMAWSFWLGQVGLGLVLPIVILTSARRRSSPGWVAAAAAVVVVGILAVRFNMVLPPQIIPVMEGLPANHYVPTWNEWLLSVGLIGAAAFGYSLVAELLPIHDRHREVPVDAAAAHEENR